MTDYPHLLAPLDLGLRDAAEPGADGLDAYRARRDRRLEPRRRVLCRAGARRASALMVTGGMAPNREGGVFPGAAGLFSAEDIANHRIVTDRVHEAGRRIAMQILHAGRYAYGAGLRRALGAEVPDLAVPAAALDEAGIEKQIADIATAAARAREAGYDGVEVMGSEGYFLNQFLVAHTNKRDRSLGRQPTRTGCACRSRWCAACARRWGAISS